MQESKKKILIQILILACVVGVFLLFSVLFRKNIEHQISNISVLKLRKQEFSQSASGIVALKKEWETAQQQEFIFAPYELRESDLVTIPQELKNMGEKLGVSVTFVYGTEAKQGNAFPGSKTTLFNIPIAYGTEVEQKNTFSSTKAIFFTASAEGGKERVVEFLKDVDDKFRTLSINTFDAMEPTPSTLRVSITGKISYYY